MNFEEDIKNEILNILKKSGLKTSKKNSVEDVLLDYFNLKQKFIEPKIRKVLIGHSFIDEIESHPKEKEITTIIDKAIKGENLNIFQSKKLTQSKFFDHLQNEWNIHHFHLSLKKEKKSIFVKQTNALLFAYVDDEKIAFLGTDTHKEGIFGDIKWIEILHDNFPEIIEPFRDYKIKEAHPNLTANERQQLWSKGVILGMTTVRGKVYHSPGIGRATSGHSITSTMNVVNIMRWVYRLKEQIEDCKQELSKLFGLKIDSNTFGIRAGDKGLELYEKSTKSKILDYPEHLISKEKMKEKINTDYNNA